MQIIDEYTLIIYMHISPGLTKVRSSQSLISKNHHFIARSGRE